MRQIMKYGAIAFSLAAFAIIGSEAVALKSNSVPQKNLAQASTITDDLTQLPPGKYDDEGFPLPGSPVVPPDVADALCDLTEPEFCQEIPENPFTGVPENTLIEARQAAEFVNTGLVEDTFGTYIAKRTAEASKDFSEEDRVTGYGCGCRSKTTVLNGNLCYQQTYELTEAGSAAESETKCRSQQIDTTANVYALPPPEVGLTLQNVQMTTGTH